MTDVLFDLDGTLTDAGPGILRSIAHALQALGRTAPPEAELRWCVGPPLRETLATLLGGAHVALAAEALRLYRERYATRGMFENDVYPGIPHALADLRDAGHRLWVATSKPHVYARRIVDHFGLGAFFAGVHGSELAGANCDKGDLVAHILRVEGLAAARTCMVGDRVHDIRGAHRNGVAAVGVLWGYGSEEELRAASPERLVAAPARLRAVIDGTVPRTGAPPWTP